jgi:predicted transcriptional regulator of viral defense system
VRSIHKRPEDKLVPSVNSALLTEVPFVQQTKAVIQRVYEHVAAAKRPVSTRELITALPDASRSSITFALTRLVREGDLRRVGHGRYVTTDESDPTVRSEEDDEYLFDLLERVRGTLSFADLAFLYELIESSRRLIPEAFRIAREHAKRRPRSGP